MKRKDAVMALRSAQLEVGHLRETRKTYRGWLIRYMNGAQEGKYKDLQGFLSHLSVVDELNPKRDVKCG
jgi:hypothetical protein